MRKALGRGLGALIPGAVPSEPPGRTTVPVDDIVVNPEQPRHHIDPDSIAVLAESIRRHGLLQPLVVERTGTGYQLIAGERRLRAAIKGGLREVPIIVRQAGPAERLELALIENLQREDLSPLDEAEAYRRLIDEYGLTQDEIGREVGKSRPAIANALRLLALPDPVKAQLEQGMLTAGHARAVLSVEGIDERVRFAREITEKKLSKSEAERQAAERRQPTRAKTQDVHLHALAETLTRDLGTRVRIVKRARGGVIEIEYYSDLELDRLVERLRGTGLPH